MTFTAASAVALWCVLFTTGVIIRRQPVTIAWGSVLGWFFLPHFELEFSGLPNLTKMIVVTTTTMVLALLVPSPGHSPSILTWRDLPAWGMTLFSIPPSLVQGLGIYDGVSAAYASFWSFTAPYIVGKRLFCTRAAARDLMRVLIGCSLFYAVFCIYEMKMSPRLHLVVYGVRPRVDENYFTQAIRYGLWRPMVFFEHGLALAIMMAMVSTLAWWCYVSGFIRKFGKWGMNWWAAFLGATTVLCVSSGAILLMGVGWVIASFGGKPLGRGMLVVLVILPFLYPISRMMGSGELIARNVESVNSAFEDRAGSFVFRVRNEEKILRTWTRSPVFGSGSQYRRTDDPFGVIVDSFWVIILGKFGLCGWVSWTLLIVGPVVYALVRRDLRVAGFASPICGIAVSVGMFANDALLNGISNPLVLVLTGASIGLLREPNENGSSALQERPERSRSSRRRLWPANNTPGVGP